MSEVDGDAAALTVSSMIKEIQGLKDKFKDEDEDTPSPFQDLEKATVLQECRCFNDQEVVTQNPRRCATLITKLLHIVTQGESLSSSEVTEVFFGVTKLFQSSDPYLRRMMYLFIKEVAETCNPDDVIIVTSSLTKDMNSNDDLYRANSIRGQLLKARPTSASSGVAYNFAAGSTGSMLSSMSLSPAEPSPAPAPLLPLRPLRTPVSFGLTTTVSSTTGSAVRVIACPSSPPPCDA
mgnify:CR=1 FL=1